jgi:integral membrane protein
MDRKSAGAKDRLRWAAILEGWSLILLLLVAMPLKYLAGMPGAVQVIGMAHGILFIIYIILVIEVKVKYKWSIQKTLLAMIASVIPLGTFYVERKWLRNA